MLWFLTLLLLSIHYKYIFLLYPSKILIYENVKELIISFDVQSPALPAQIPTMCLFYQHFCNCLNVI